MTREYAVDNKGKSAYLVSAYTAQDYMVSNNIDYIVQYRSYIPGILSMLLLYKYGGTVYLVNIRSKGSLPTEAFLRFATDERDNASQ